MTSVSVFDVANYILDKKGFMTAMKIQKLVYYSQAWSLVWDEEELYQEEIQAWANGPVVKDLYIAHRGEFRIRRQFDDGDKNKLSPRQQSNVDKVLDFYGNKSSQWLSDLTHNELPWIISRNGLAASERGDKEITTSSMAEYYSNL